MQKEETLDGHGQNINDAALEYMEQKYGEKFEYVAPWGNSLTGTHEIIVTCGSMADQDIVVQISDYKEEKKTFQDNYLAVKYYEETMEFLNQCANDVFGDAKVYYKVAKKALSAELSADASFEEYFADAEGFLSVYIAVRASSYTERKQIKNVTDHILSACGAGYLSILVIVVDDFEYEILDGDALGKKVVLRQFVHCARLTKEGSDVELEWLEED